MLERHGSPHCPGDRALPVLEGCNDVLVLLGSPHCPGDRELTEWAPLPLAVASSVDNSSQESGTPTTPNPEMVCLARLAARWIFCELAASEFVMVPSSLAACVAWRA